MPAFIGSAVLASILLASSAPTGAPPSADPPRYRGTALLVSGGLLSATAFSLQIAATHLSVVTRDRDPSTCGDEGCRMGVFLYTLGSAPTFALSIGLLGGGMHLAGRRAAHDDALRGRRRDTRWMMGVGYSLLGAGLGVFSLGTGLGKARDSWPAVDTAWLLGPGLGTAGAMLAGYGTSYHIHTRRSNRSAQLRVTPIAGRDITGLSVAGRF